jgi:pimeloyl-ACP methyl ester carboxylesterase
MKRTGRQKAVTEMTNVTPINVDFVEAGSVGPVVMLVHSSVSGARQWRRLMEDLKDRFRVRAVNLFGYGKTPPWPAEATQSLDDQARLVEAALPAHTGEIYLVGHSFGGSVAMKTAARLCGRVARLVLLETNPFYLLGQFGRIDAFAEALELRNCVKKFGALGEWATAAEKFAEVAATLAPALPKKLQSLLSFEIGPGALWGDRRQARSIEATGAPSPRMLPRLSRSAS